MYYQKPKEERTWKSRYNVTGAKRKELVKVISKATGMKAVYKFMPTCNFEIGSFTVNKEGTLLIDAQTDNEGRWPGYWRPLRQAGFEGETQDTKEAPAEEVLAKEDAAETAEPTETDITEEADNNEEEQQTVW